MDWRGIPIDGRWCSCTDAPPARYHHRRCHHVPYPSWDYRITVAGVKKAAWTIRGWDAAYSLAQALRRAYPDRWIDIKLDGTLCALLEPRALAEDESEQLELA